METKLILLLTLYGVIGGVLGAAAARWAMRNFYPFRIGRLRYASGAAQLGCIFSGILAAGVAVALDTVQMAAITGFLGMAVAAMIAAIQGQPGVIGVDLPPEIWDAVHSGARNPALLLRGFADCPETEEPGVLELLH